MREQRVGLVYLSILAATLAFVSTGCPDREIVPLIGEDPEVADLLGEEAPDSAHESALAAARRLHQALVQGDTELAWSLLANETRDALDKEGAAIGTSGRELLDASTLPGRGGTVRKVRFESVFFGGDVVELTEPSGAKISEGEQKIFSVDSAGNVTELRFLKEDGEFRLLKTNF